ncbi:concanavalin A-like lectin/glucanase domain-containing protein, partial [Phascolomyces articulosus]
FCGTEDSVQYGDYNVYNNLIGRSTSGSQCTELIRSGINGGGKSVAWRTTWSWSGEEKKIKSFANAAHHHEPTPFVDTTEIPTIWEWTTTASESEQKYNVALNIFTSEEGPKDSGKNYEYQIEIWLDRTGDDVKPIGNQLDGSSFTPGGDSNTGEQYLLFSGSNGVQTVFTFVATQKMNYFEGDLALFIQELIDRGYMSGPQVIGAIRGGTTAYVGEKVEFITNQFKVSI